MLVRNYTCLIIKGLCRLEESASFIGISIVSKVLNSSLLTGELSASIISMEFSAKFDVLNLTLFGLITLGFLFERVYVFTRLVPFKSEESTLIGYNLVDAFYC